MLTFVLFIVLLSSWSSEGAQLSFQATNVILCSDPGLPEHAGREDDLSSFSPGQDVIFTCEFTYKLIGSQKRTCLSNGTWSGVQPKCEVYMCDELDAWVPQHGKRFGHVFTIGNNLTFDCLVNYKLKGDKVLQCLPNGQWSANPPTCQHICEAVKCGTGEICRAINGITSCSCRDNMECSSLVNTVCGSDSVTYINEGIMNATACRENKEIRRIQSGHCVPGDICSIFPQSKCRAAFNVFYYNVSKGGCGRMMAGGCHPSGWNGFWSKKDCKHHCAKDICAMKPDYGPCSTDQIRWYYDTFSKTCQQFRYGGCFGSSNNFQTQDDCMKRCDTKNKKKPIFNIAN